MEYSPGCERETCCFSKRKANQAAAGSNSYSQECAPTTPPSPRARPGDAALATGLDAVFIDLCRAPGDLRLTGKTIVPYTCCSFHQRFVYVHQAV